MGGLRRSPLSSPLDGAGCRSLANEPDRSDQGPVLTCPSEAAGASLGSPAQRKSPRSPTGPASARQDRLPPAHHAASRDASKGGGAGPETALGPSWGPATALGASESHHARGTPGWKARWPPSGQSGVYRSDRGRASGLKTPWGPVDPPGEQVPGFEWQPSDS
jgi:hypothetical protein